MKWLKGETEENFKDLSERIAAFEKYHAVKFPKVLTEFFKMHEGMYMVLNDLLGKLRKE